MTTTILDLEIIVSKNEDDCGEELDHLYCECDKNIGLCGTDLTGMVEMTWEDPEENPCVVCYEMDPHPCPKCGNGPNY